MDIQKIKLDKIQINKDNPRTITKEKFDKLVNSILVFPKMLDIRPIVVDGNFIALGGNQRTEALKAISKMEITNISDRLAEVSDFQRMDKADQENLIIFWSRWLKNKDVPIINAETLTEDEKKQFIIKDNNGFGEWNFAELTEKWDTNILQDWGVDFPENWALPEEETQEAKEDDFTEEDAANVKTRVKAGEIWQLGEHRLMCGDSTKIEDVKKLIGDEVIDLVVTDPPYNVDYEGKEKFLLNYRPNERVKKGTNTVIENDKMSETHFIDFLQQAFRNMNSILKNGGAFYIWHADTEGLSFRLACKNSGLKVRQCIIWVKNHFVLGRQDYQWIHEPCLYGWKEGTHYFRQDRTQKTVFEDDIRDYKKLKKTELIQIIEELLQPKQELTILRENKPSKNDEHPTMKPVKLIARCIINSTKIGEKVLDMFGGSGTTLIASEQLNRKCFMMELDSRYCDVILSRWEKLTGKEAAKIYG